MNRGNCQLVRQAAEAAGLGDSAGTLVAPRGRHAGQVGQSSKGQEGGHGVRSHFAKADYSAMLLEQSAEGGGRGPSGTVPHTHMLRIS